jgi:hypothetical protein
MIPGIPISHSRILEFWKHFVRVFSVSALFSNTVSQRSSLTSTNSHDPDETELPADVYHVHGNLYWMCHLGHSRPKSRTLAHEA